MQASNLLKCAEPCMTGHVQPHVHWHVYVHASRAIVNATLKLKTIKQ